MTQRHCVPGSRPDEYLDADEMWGAVEGKEGQSILREYLGRVGVPGCRDRYGWAPLDDLPVGSIVLDLSADDIAAGIAEGAGHVHPFVGPTLDINGVIVAGLSTPWVDWLGRAVTMARFNAGGYLRTALGVSLDPADDQDIAVFLLGRPRYSSAAGGTGCMLSSRPYGGGRGFMIAGQCSMVVEGNAAVTSGSTLVNSLFSQALVEALILRGGNQTIGANANTGDTDPAPAGSYAGGARFTVANDTALGRAFGLGLSRLVIVYSAGLGAIITATWRQRLASCVFGHRATLSLTPGTPTTYARASDRCCYPEGTAGRLHILSANCPPTEGANGLGADGQIVSATSKNHGFTSGDGTLFVTDKDAGITIDANPTDDTANLAAKVPDACGLVIKITGSGVVRFGNVLGAGDNWESIRVRWTGAGTVEHGFATPGAGGAFTKVGNCVNAYDRSYGSAAGLAAGKKQALNIPAGAAPVYAVVWCAGPGIDIPDEVPSLAAVGVSSTVVEGIVTIPEALSPLSGGVEAVFEPRFWGGGPGTAAPDLIRHGADPVLGLDGAGHVLTKDAGGVHTASFALVELDGLLETLRASRGSLGLHVGYAGGGAGAFAVLGTMNATTTIRGRGRRRLRRLTIYRNPIWGRP